MESNRAVWTEQWQIISDLFGSDLQHQIFDEHFP
jgi:hypothetical protein